MMNQTTKQASVGQQSSLPSSSAVSGASVSLGNDSQGIEQLLPLVMQLTNPDQVSESMYVLI